MYPLQFGGEWTDEKLDCLKDYLEKYRLIFSENQRASWYRTHYVDAFAGAGYRFRAQTKNVQSTLLFDLEEMEAEAEDYTKGSARIALEINPPFHNYLFIEKNFQHVQELEKLKGKFPNIAPRIDIKQGDANNILCDWCKKIDWKYNRAVVFLDPYGMQVEWSLLQTIAATKGIDLWILFPLGSINRLLKRGELPPEEWTDLLIGFSGLILWRKKFYSSLQVQTFLGQEETVCKDATFEGIGNFFIERLKTIFTKVADNPLQLCNSKNYPLYLLCFASGNPKGAEPAVKIASYILERKEDNMATATKIEWTEMTWNPVSGCTKISEGCKNCYAERMAKRLQAMGVKRYQNAFKM